MSDNNKCDWCEKEVDQLFRNPLIMIDIKTGKQVSDEYICKDCVYFAIEELA
ncbi:hypothetical protein [Tuberibacillus sp. Marseille-P3662]|uniref:hypothetical protein n=1 Tax=Tuberibacillus sp. Marseille-P3662 TaxID=1965358 RepID=UPI0015942171|nr:hypothetical protein [Tuberibacillus sp. Marseille-P3662]